MATRQWTNSVSGTFDFNNPANWAFGVVPDAIDIAQLNSGAVDTITGNATIAEILASLGTYSLAGTYAISGAQPTELSVTASGSGADSLTILAGAMVNGSQAVSVSGASALLAVQGGLIASSLAVANSGSVFVYQGSSLVVSGAISLSGGALLAGRGGAGPAIAIGNAIQTSGTVSLGSYDGRVTAFNGVISGSGAITLAGDGLADTVAFNGANTYTGGTTLSTANLTLAVGNASGLGTGALTITGGELLASATETIANQLTMSGNFTIAAARGQFLTLSSSLPWSLTASASEVITFGAPGQDGVVIFKDTGGASITNFGTQTINVQAGTLAAGDGGLSFLLGDALATVVQAGAVIDAVGFALSIVALQGGGQVTDSGAATTFTLSGNGSFSGVISGPLAVTVAGGATILSGANTYTGGTTISAGATLTLGAGAASGSVTGAITDNGTLVINRSDAFALNNISGPGQLVQSGSGTTILGSGLSYSGGTVINAGVLSVGSSSALGAGALTLTGGELLASATETIANQLTMSGNFTIAAAHGQTLTLGASQAWHLTASAGEVINFGSPGQDGVIVFNTAVGSSITLGGPYTVDVQAGTLRAGNISGISFLMGNDVATIVQSGATIDAAGFDLQTVGLQGAGRVTDSGAAATLSVFGGDFTGLIDGAFALSVFGNVTLAGADTYTGGTTINVGAELTLGNGGPTGSIAGAITDSGILEFHLSGATVENGVISGTGSLVQDGSGTTVLTQANSYTGGTLLGGGGLELQQPGSVGSGTITFLNETTTTLQIDGVSMPSNQIIGFNDGDAIDLSNIVATGWSYSGGVLTLLNGSTTVALLNLSTPFAHPDFGVASDGAAGTIIHLEPPPADFTGNGFSGLLWQNTDGTPAVWEVNGTSVLASAQFGNPGAAWRLAGAGDFNGDGTSDLLFQNSDGTAFIWEMNGTNIISGGPVGNPGSSWRLVGTGDFNGDGESDLLWQNSNGTAFTWEMNGTSIIGGGTMGNPGPSWRLVGTGDFNGDGKSDVLWQNSDGTPFIWEMNGTSTIGGGPLGNPGASWHLIGTGDFNGDGKSDLLWQNTDGTAAIWEMNGTNVLASVQVGNPGASWHLIGAGDFNGDGKSDILWQNNDGTPFIWEMNGTNIIGGGPLGDPGSSWHLIHGF